MPIYKVTMGPIKPSDKLTSHKHTDKLKSTDKLTSNNHTVKLNSMDKLKSNNQETGHTDLSTMDTPYI